MSIYLDGELQQPGLYNNPLIIDTNNAETLLVRKDSDGGDIFVVDTTNGVVAVGGVAPVSGCRFVIPQENDAATPTFAFGDGDTGFYENPDDSIKISVGGAARFNISSTAIEGLVGGSFHCRNVAATGTVPVITFNNDTDTGIGRSNDNQLALITGGIGCTYINAAGATNRWGTQVSVNDDATVSMPSAGSNGGFGFAQMGDGEEYALFTFTSAAAVTLISNSANVVNTDTDTNFCILDTGTVVGFKNRLGSAKNLFAMIWYN